VSTEGVYTLQYLEVGIINQPASNHNLPVVVAIFGPFLFSTEAITWSIICWLIFRAWNLAKYYYYHYQVVKTKGTLQQRANFGLNVEG